MASDIVDGHESLTPERAWWLRVPAVLLSPRPVFFALRDDDPDDIGARAEPLLLIVILAGIASLLATPTASDILDSPDYDALLLAVWAFIVGGLYGALGYLVLGFVLFFGVRLLGSLGTFRRARQLVGFALVPLAGSLVILLPLRLALFGGDTFRTGGSDAGGGDVAILVLQFGFIGWSLVLLAIGVQVVHGWTWAAVARGDRSRGSAPSCDRRRARLDVLTRPPRTDRAPRAGSRTCAAPPGNDGHARQLRMPAAPHGSCRRSPRIA